MVKYWSINEATTLLKYQSELTVQHGKMHVADFLSNKKENNNIAPLNQR